MAVNSEANQATATDKTKAKDAIKIASPALLALTNPPLDPASAQDIMLEVLFEDIGGHELINISRSDAINGQDISYSIIKNLKNVLTDYNSNNIIRLQGAADTYFKNFSISIEKKLPEKGTGPNEETVYIEASTGNLIVNIINLETDERVEIEILSQEETFDDTIVLSEV
jgi:uncharacterized protein YciU (UPF0263 family)